MFVTAGPQEIREKMGAELPTEHCIPPRWRIAADSAAKAQAVSVEVDRRITAFWVRFMGMQMTFWSVVVLLGMLYLAS
jgi:hypothetical protein